MEHEREPADASEEGVEEITHKYINLQKDHEEIRRQMGYVLEQLASFTGVQSPQQFVSILSYNWWIIFRSD